MKQIAFILFLNIALTTIAMEQKATVNQPPAQIQQSAADKTVTTFLWSYAIAKFCDIDERGVYFNQIEADEEQATFTLPWNKVTAVLEKAFEDIERFDFSKEQSSLPRDYKNVLQQIKEFHSLARYRDAAPDAQVILFNVLGENRSLYKGAWRSGDPVLVKAALDHLVLFDTCHLALKDK